MFGLQEQSVGIMRSKYLLTLTSKHDIILE